MLGPIRNWSEQDIPDSAFETQLSVTEPVVYQSLNPTIEKRGEETSSVQEIKQERKNTNNYQLKSDLPILVVIGFIVGVVIYCLLPTNIIVNIPTYFFLFFLFGGFTILILPFLNKL